MFIKKVKKSHERIIKNKKQFYIGWWMERILIPIFPPLPIPIPGVSKSLQPGGKKLEANHCWIIFIKKVKQIPCQGIGYWALGIMTYVRIKYLNQVPFTSDS